jgi:hypothetical protein
LETIAEKLVAKSTSESMPVKVVTSEGEFNKLTGSSKLVTITATEIMFRSQLWTFTLFGVDLAKQ